MESPPGSDSNTRILARASMIDSIRGCSVNLSGTKISKKELKLKITMPLYLRLAMIDAINAREIDAGIHYYDPHADPIQSPEAPIVVFTNPRSGGRHGPELKLRLQELMSNEQVFNLSDVKPHEFVKYALGCLEKMAELGDNCARLTRERLRVIVAGGDGTVGWVLGCLGELHKQGRNPVPPTGIIPLGTGNDLSRNFYWGGSFPFNWKPYVKRVLGRVVSGPTFRLDSWDIHISLPAGASVETPYSLTQKEDHSLDEELEVEAELPDDMISYEGVFYNYFSIGMDAQVAYGFHHLRNEKPYLAQGPIANKLIYSGYGCKQGWFFTPCIADPTLRGLKNIMRMHVKKINSTNWELVPLPASVRSLVVLNLQNYGSGRNPWGNLKPEYMEKKGFVEAQPDDGLLEVFGLKQGWHASFVMVELISAKHIAQASAIRFEFRGGEWREAFMQIDGEPWKQPMDKDYSTFVEIKRVPFQSVMISGDHT